MINHTILDAIRSYVDEQGLVGAVLMDSDVEGMAEAVDAALNPPVPEFTPETLVEVTRDNTAHAVIGDDQQWACHTPHNFLTEVARHAQDWKRMTWAQTKDKAYKPWGAWPCQTCVSRMQGYMP